MPNADVPKVDPANVAPKKILKLAASKVAPPKAHAPKPPLAERNSIAEQAFSSRFDALNEAILQAEVHLRSVKSLHGIWHEYRTVCTDDGEPERSYYVGFDKFDGKWRLLHSEVESGCPNDSVNIPLTDCPIDARVRASQCIPKLYEKIVESKEEFIKNVDGTIAILKSFTQQK